jgi:catechol 2,3-dioxygenase-like lactoylglutathione lyase family enzyme
VRGTVTHDPDRRREIAHVGPVELCTPVLEESRDFFVEQMGLREVHRDAASAQPTFFRYVWEPGGNRVELCHAGARLILAPDWKTISWTAAERAKGQAWGLKTIDTFHTHGTPVVP